MNGGDIDLLSIEEAAELLGFTTETHRAPSEAMRWLCRQRRVRHVKLGKRYAFQRQWLIDFLEEESVAPVRRAQ